MTAAASSSSNTQPAVEAEETPVSPRAMAEAALAAAVAERDQASKTKSRNVMSNDHSQGSSQENPSTNKKRRRDEDNLTTTTENTIIEKWRAIGQKSRGEDDDIQMDDQIQKALNATESFISHDLESLIRQGLQSFQTNDNLSLELSRTTELAESRSRELRRLQSSETQNRKSISNLLKTIETSKSETRDASRSALVEARLREEISTLRSERDKAYTRANESRRRVERLEEELRLVKAKLVRVAQEKIKMERDSRAAISLARSLDGGRDYSSSRLDVDFYKRKATELGNRLQAQETINGDQKRRIDELTRQVERSVSQNRLAAIRKEEMGRVRF